MKSISSLEELKAQYPAAAEHLTVTFSFAFSELKGLLNDIEIIEDAMKLSWFQLTTTNKKETTKTILAHVEEVAYRRKIHDSFSLKRFHETLSEVHYNIHKELSRLENLYESLTPAPSAEAAATTEEE